MDRPHHQRERPRQRHTPPPLIREEDREENAKILIATLDDRDVVDAETRSKSGGIQTMGGENDERNSYCECAMTSAVSNGELQSSSSSSSSSSTPWSVQEMLANAFSSEHVVIIVHALVFFIVMFLIVRALHEEYKRARTAWMTSGSESEVGGVFTAAPRSVNEEGEDDEPSSSALQLGSPVVHPMLGRGDVVSFDMRGGVVVHYDATDEKRLHTADEKGDLLQIGMRVNHPQRGPGRVKKFDEQGRVHVEFENGEYHRYKHDAWKSKITGSGKTPKSKKNVARAFMFDYLFYRLDYVFSHYPFAKTGLLVLATYFLILVGGIAYSAASGEAFGDSVWRAWTLVADPGAHADERGALHRSIALTLTVGGMLVFALMISIIAESVSSLLDGLKQGNSAVIESGHTLILGWSDKVLPLLREIALANESCGGGVVVILAPRPKAEMEREIKKEFPPEDSRGTVVVCRSGNATSQLDLKKVSASAAKSIVVLASTEDPDQSDAYAVRVVMSLTGIRSSKMGHVVVEMCDVDNRDLVLLVDNSHVEVVVAHDLIGRLMIQCAREPGLAQILEEIMGFEGDEFYLKEFPGLAGITFGEAMFRFPDAVPLGVKPKDRRNAYEQIVNSQWRLESLKRRGFDGEIVDPNASPRVVRGDSDPKSSSSPRDKTSSSPSPASGQDGSSSRLPSVDDGGFACIPETLPAVVDHFVENASPAMQQQLQRRDDTNDLISREVVLNPPNDYVFQPGDEILVLAEDDDTFSFKEWEEMNDDGAAKRSYENMQPAHRPVVQNQPEKILFCGWRRDIDDMIMELDKLVGAGSELTIMSMVPMLERERRFRGGGLDVSRLRNLKIEHVVGNPILRRDLDLLKLQHFSSVLVLADEDLETNVSSADSKSLASLLLIRDMIAKRNLASTYSGGMPSPSTTSTGTPSTGSASSFVRPKLLPQASDGSMNIFFGGRPRLQTQTSSDKLMFGGDAGGGFTRLSRKTSGQASPTTASFTVSSSSLLGSSGRNSWKPNALARRPSSVGADLYFENAQGVGRTVIISEILDSRTKALIPIARVSDHVMSNEIVAAALAMVSEDRCINVVLSEILQADGNDLHIRASLDYVGPTERIDFWELMARARARGEIAIGYRLSGEKSAVLNPRKKDARFCLGARGTVVVLAED